ncbi:hypothetical protein U1701_02225 [Sphingomonas sp. PB2P19]|uniref:hypothetical protein n=1 Tax=Sphingomonas rhamnosi TaxID=3096156 RepID=UPI002FCA1DBB
MTERKEPRPQRGMIIGIVVGLMLAAILLAIFYSRVQQPAVDAKPTQAPLKTQR